MKHLLIIIIFGMLEVICSHGQNVGVDGSGVFYCKKADGSDCTINQFPVIGGAWGSITGTLSTQTDLQTALNAKVPTTTTVNSHALSSNVVVSASDLTTGNLPSAQLPTGPTWPTTGSVLTTLSSAGSFPTLNQSTTGNAATATALASTPSLCAANNAPTGINASGTPQGCTLIAAGGVTTSILTADSSTSASTTLVSTALTFSLAASTNYTLECNIAFTVSTTATNGLALALAGPGTPTQISINAQIPTSATAVSNVGNQGAVWLTKIGTVATTVTTYQRAWLTGLVENGTTAGTMTVQFSNLGITGLTTIKRGSWCKLQ